jgi:superoxide dismutase, Fe-Mn family
MKPIFTLPFETIDGFLSSIQLSEHYKLYEGYYKQTQIIPATINGIGSSANPNSIRGLQKTLQYALSGRVLHEIYFGQMSLTPTNIDTISAELLELINASFGSLDTYIADMNAAAVTCRGWYRLEYDAENNILYHNVGDFHDEGSTTGFVPLIALDMYDHAYFYDYQTRKGEYVNNFIVHLDWTDVNQRLTNARQ